MINYLLFAILFPLLSAPLLIWAGPKLKQKLGWLCLAVPASSAVAIINVLSHSIVDHKLVPQVLTKSWVPSLGINLSFLVDGVSVFFGLVVAIMGFLVVLYAKYYLHETLQDNARFYAYLMLFMSAMLGTVFSNNLFVMLVFWEFTGITSFLLIGFSHEKKASRNGALMAFITTGLTGLVLMVGLILLSILFNGVSDFHVISEQVAGKNLVDALSAVDLAYFKVAMILIMIGAFGKSAQFPLHYWLPNAMAAPTPVSAYLHSAAMVKLGVFLTARFFPIFESIPEWGTLLIWVGFITMTIGGIFSFLSNDLKGILAYTTVSQLGFLIGYYGIGVQGLEHDYFQILNHVFYKGSLFMIAGIVIHTVHTKDIRQIGGLFKFMPLAAIAATITGLSMAGIPGTMGFVSKELMVEKVLKTVHVYEGGIYWALPVMLFVSAICLIATGIRFIYHCFYRKEIQSNADIKKVSIMFQLPPFILAIGALIFGLNPELAGHYLNELNNGYHAKPYHLAVLHGLTPGVIFGCTIIGSGILLYFISQKLSWKFAHIPSALLFETYFLNGIKGLKIAGRKIAELIKTDKEPLFLQITLTAFVIILWATGWETVLNQIGPVFTMDHLQTDPITIIQFAAGLVLALAAIGTVVSRSPIAKFISLSVVGFVVSFYFMLFRAPDLALTQLLIEAASLALILILFSRLPNTFSGKSPKIADSFSENMVKIIVSIAFGAFMTSLILLATLPSKIKHMGQYFIDQTNPLAGGSNAVNTILVDFRGFDTMGEITVLAVAMLGIVGLLTKRAKEKKTQ